MFKKRKNLLILILGIVIVTLGFNLSLGSYLSTQKSNKVLNLLPTQAKVSQDKSLDRFTYKGKEGVDALSLLKEKTKIEQNSTGLVTSINGKKSNERDREYWAFYVNEELSEVGPKNYITKSTDSIEWKLERY